MESFSWFPHFPMSPAPIGGVRISFIVLPLVTFRRMVQSAVLAGFVEFLGGQVPVKLLVLVVCLGVEIHFILLSQKADNGLTFVSRRRSRNQICARPISPMRTIRTHKKAVIRIMSRSSSWNMMPSLSVFHRMPKADRSAVCE